MDSSNDNVGSRAGSDEASNVFPHPGGPIIQECCVRLLQQLQGPLALACPLMSDKSVICLRLGLICTLGVGTSFYLFWSHRMTSWMSSAEMI